MAMHIAIAMIAKLWDAIYISINDDIKHSYSYALTSTATQFTYRGVYV